MTTRARRTPQLVVIYWRDIPAQVNAQLGRDRHQMLLPVRFQRAVDRAKRKAGVVTADEDVAQWRRETLSLEGDPAAAAEAEVRRLDRDYDGERLGRLVLAGGFERDVDPTAEVSVKRLAALEELKEEVRRRRQLG